ncbi:MAG: ribonuclease Y [Phycisphaerales bacterium JB039]
MHQQILLATGGPPGGGLAIALAAIVALVVGVGIGLLITNLIGSRRIAAAEAKAKEIIERAQSDARGAAEKIRLEAEKEALERRAALDEESEGIRRELRDAERRILKREDLMDRKEETLATKEQALEKSAESLRSRERGVEQREGELASLLEDQKLALSRVAEMSREEAREALIQRVVEESRHEMAKVSRKIVEAAEEDARQRATEVILGACQRFAAETASEALVRTVAIPSDDMKGRIIGREGRNIRAFEKAAGVDIIVDDTPGAIVVSCFDKVRQTVAVEALEILIADGRLHPSRIEEVIAKVQAEMDERVRKIGKDAQLEVNLRGLHPKVVEAMGRLHFRTSYSQNVLRHSIEVAYLSQLIAEQLGLDGTIARRCGFLHDIGKAMDHEMEGGHPKIGMDFARQHGEKEPVLNAIGGHHADIPSTSFYTPIVMAADAVSGARPGARRDSMERYVQRLQELQDIALGFKGVVEAYAIQAGREVRVMVDAGKVSDDESHWIAQQIAKRVSEELTFPGEIRVTVLRETRAIEIAR